MGLVGVGTGCSGPARAPVDAGPTPLDAGLDAADDAAPIVGDPAAAALPVFTPCPPGWRTVAAGDAETPVTCDPWPEGGPGPCADDEAWLPGDPGCTRIGAACPATDDFPVDLPAGVPTFFVRNGAVSGDGTRGAPFGTLAEAAVAAAGVPPPGAVIAIARGRYELTDALSLAGPVTLQGACAAETTIVAPLGTLPRPSLRPLVAITLRDLRFEGPSLVMNANTVDVVLRAVVIDGAATLPIAHSRATFDAEDVVVRGCETAFSFDRSTVSLRRVRIDDARGAAVALGMSTLTAADSAFFGAGVGGSFVVEANAGSAVHMERVVLAGGNGFGALVNDASTFELVDAVVTGVAPPAPGTDEGMLVLGASSVQLSRVRMMRARSYALLVGEAATRGELEDVLVTDVFGNGTGLGEALAAEQGATVTVHRMLVAHAHGIGIFASGPDVALDLQDVTVRDTDPGPAGDWGRGLQAQLGTYVTGARVRLARNREAALVAASVGSSVVLTDLDVSTTLERACALTSCAGAGGGIGAGAYVGATMSLTRFRIASSALAGLQIARSGALDLHEGHVTSSPVGINVQVPAYDFSRLADRVVFRDNGTNLDSSELPIPAPDTGGL